MAEKLGIFAVVFLFLSQACSAENQDILNNLPRNGFLEAKAAESLPNDKIQQLPSGSLRDAPQFGGELSLLQKHGRVLTEEIVKPIVEEFGNIGRSLTNISKTCIGLKTSRNGGQINLQIGTKAFTWACAESVVNAMKTIILAVRELVPNVGKAVVVLLFSVLRDIFTLSF